MKHRTVRYSVAAAAITAVVLLLGSVFVDGHAQRGLIVGGMTGFVLQVLVFKALLAGPLHLDPFVGHVLGMIGRLFALGLTAFVVLPATRLSPAPTLFALVTVFWLTTLVEPRYCRMPASRAP